MLLSVVGKSLIPVKLVGCCCPAVSLYSDETAVLEFSECSEDQTRNLKIYIQENIN